MEPMYRITAYMGDGTSAVLEGWPTAVARTLQWMAMQPSSYDGRVRYWGIEITDNPSLTADRKTKLLRAGCSLKSCIAWTKKFGQVVR